MEEIEESEGLRIDSAPTALITGAGGSLGGTCAALFAGAGYDLACVDLNFNSAERAVRELQSAGGRTFALGCDVGDPEAVNRMISNVIRDLGRLDVVINNAEVDCDIGVEEMTLEQWDSVMRVNLRGPFLVARAALPMMRAQGHGHIVNVASTTGRGWKNAAAYHASKWGLLGFSRSLSVEASPYNVRVSALVPGGLRGTFLDRFTEQGEDVVTTLQPQSEAEMAQAILLAVVPAAEMEVAIPPA